MTNAHEIAPYLDFYGKMGVYGKGLPNRVAGGS